MPKYRIEYAKFDEARFLSHLELLRVWHRVFRRARLPQTFTQGFNPHQKLSFGPPLSVGVAGRHEYLDLDLSEGVPVRETIERIIKECPPGLTVGQLMPLHPGASSLGKEIDSAWYRAEIPSTEIPLERWQEVLVELGESEPWCYQRERDGKLFDVKKGVLAARVLPTVVGVELDLLLIMGEGEVPLRGVVQQISKLAGVNTAPQLLRITRYGLSRQRKQLLVNPMGETKEFWEE
jgi:radical SAM-linked protein